MYELAHMQAEHAVVCESSWWQLAFEDLKYA